MKVMKTTISAFVLLLFSLFSTNAQDSLAYGLTFTTQEEIDNFKLSYPNCTYIGGYLHINYGENITNLNGLSSITTVDGDLMIVDNHLLVSLTGLDSLTTINGGLGIVGNEHLTDLTSLKNVRSISGNLTVGWNHRLKRLDGLDSINAETIQHLNIYFNDSLRMCEAESVCSYLKIFGSASIFNNSPGCNSSEEVDYSCETIGVSDQNHLNEFELFPNPAHDVLYILTPDNITITETKIYDNFGKLIETAHMQKKLISISTVPKGMYIVELFSGQMHIRKKLVVH